MTRRQNRPCSARPRRAALAILVAASSLAARGVATGATVPGKTAPVGPGPRPVLEDLLERGGVEADALGSVLALADEAARLQFVTQERGQDPARLFAAAFLLPSASGPGRGEPHLPVVTDLAVALELLRRPHDGTASGQHPVSLPVNGVVPSPESVAAAERLPVALRSPLAALLAGLADADRWVRLAWRRVPVEVAREAARCRGGTAAAFDPEVFPAALEDAAAGLDRPSLAFATVKVLSSLGRAEKELEGAISRVPADLLGSLFWEVETSRGVVRVSGTESHLYEERASERLLLAVDLGGDDAWSGGAAARWPEQPVSVVLDLDGRDSYEGSSVPGQGSGCGGVGVLWDVRGDDRRRTVGAGQAFGWLGAGVLVDGGGDDVYLAGRGGQASSVHGWALLLDRSGTDRYETLGDGQGFAGPGGASLLADLAGNDTYASVSDPARAGSPDPRAEGRASVSNAQGAGVGRRGDLSDGHTADGGTGALVDLGGNDAFRCGTWCQGVGYRGGTGLLVDVDGDDLHEAFWYAAGSAAHEGRGALVDLAGNDRHLLTGTAGAGLGFGWDRAHGLFFDGAGNDAYRARRLALGSAARRSVGVFVDRSGNDRYEVEIPVECLGAVDDDVSWRTRSPLEPWWRDTAQAGLFADLGGRDAYPEGRAGQDRRWGSWDLAAPLLGPRNVAGGVDSEGGLLPAALERLGSNGRLP